MHDPLTVAFTIPYPWRGKPSLLFPNGYRRPFITIWHRDPEKRGNDDSCDWAGFHRPLNAREKALWHALDDLFHKLGNAPYYPDSRLYGTDPHGEDARGWGVVGHAQRAVGDWQRRSKWRIPVRWHVHHWRLQVHPLQGFKRWAFTRCAECGGRFKWGESGIGTWSGDGPRWFRSEMLTHMDCDAIRSVTSPHAAAR